jgi:hypothetical protein
MCRLRQRYEYAADDKRDKRCQRSCAQECWKREKKEGECQEAPHDILLHWFEVIRMSRLNRMGAHGVASFVFVNDDYFRWFGGCAGPDESDDPWQYQPAQQEVEHGYCVLVVMAPYGGDNRWEEVDGQQD